MYVPRGIAQKIVQPNEADGMYLHMGGQSPVMTESDYINDEVSLGFQSMGGYEEPKASSIYSEIDDAEPTYQTIDEIMQDVKSCEVVKM